MADARPEDILYRCGGGSLRRLQTLVAAGPGRGVEVPYTYSRATVKRAFRDRDGLGRRAAAGSMAFDWPTGLVDASGSPIGGFLSEGARTQLVSAPENYGAWTPTGTPTLTTGQADPFGGTGATLVDDNDAAAAEYLFLTPVTFTGDGTKCASVFMRAGTSVKSTIAIFDITAGAHRHTVDVTWTAGVPSMATVLGAGVLFPIESWGAGWYRLNWNGTGVIAANVNRIYHYPTERAAVAAVGTAYFFGTNAWNSPFPSSYQSPTESAGVADALPSSFNWGPSADITVLVRLGRAYHMDASGALGVSPGIFSFGAGAAARIGAYFDPAARNIISAIDTATTDATQTTAIPAGNPVICIQYKNLTTGGQTALDVGSGFTAFSSAATPFSAFSSQTLRIGRYDDELFGVLGEMTVLRGLFTRTEAMAVA